MLARIPRSLSLFYAHLRNCQLPHIINEMPLGRPALHTPEIESEILTRIESGESLRAICADEKFPAASTVSSWSTHDQPPGFAARYARAREKGYDAIAEQTFTIADNLEEDANSRRVRIDTRKWFLAKMMPKRYGDRVEIAGDKDNPLQVNVNHSAELLETRINSLLARGSENEVPAEPDSGG